MKTILIDNSLCVYTLRDDVNPDYIYRYIEALGEAGVKYVELDFRALMKMKALPRNIGYIFRLVDPMFLRLCEVFDFDYVHLTLSDIKKGVRMDRPVMLGLSAGENLSAKVFHYAKQALRGEITAVRLRGSFPMMSRESAAGYISHLKNEVPVPIDICPMNGRKTALDTAMKFTAANVDSLTLSLGQGEKFCALESYFFTLLTVFNRLPKEYSFSALCRAAAIQRVIFRNCTEFIPELFRIAEQDNRTLRNVDTGEPSRIKVNVFDSQVIRRAYVTALERLAREEDIPEDIFVTIEDAIRRFDASFFNDDILGERKQVFLN